MLGTAMAAAMFGCVTNAEEAADASYATITEVLDYGSAITKLVVDLGQQPEDGTSVSADDFSVSVERKYAGTEDLVQEMSYETFSYAVSAAAQGERTITNAYFSDTEGNEVSDPSDYVTLELEYGPMEGFGNPLGAELEDGLGLNVVLDCDYTIRYTGSDGTELIVDQKNDAGCIIPGVDEFTHGQSYTTADQKLLDDGLNNDTLYYASYSPKADDEKHPLIVWLHGMGEGGTDTRVPMMAARATTLVGEEIQGLMNGAYVLVPQCPTVWMDTDGSGQINLTAEAHISIYTQTLMELISSYVENTPEVDTNRIYIGGCSNGGYMTMNMLFQYPDYFAAAYPVCEAYNDEFITDEELESIKDIPIWFTHSAADPLVTPDTFTVPTYERLTAMDASNIHFTHWTDVHDMTGLYKDEAGNPYVYFGHASWQYALANQCTIDNDYVDGKTADDMGTGETLFAWLAEQSK